jgi:hypothetical protein
MQRARCAERRDVRRSPYQRQQPTVVAQMNHLSSRGRSSLQGLTFIAGLASALAIAQPAHAEPAHDGALIRLTLGLGGASTVSDTVPEVTLSGAAGFFSLDIGGSVGERWALHARLSANSMVEPTVSVDGEELGEVADSSLSYSLLGLGLTHYFPSNLYLTAVLGLANATLEIDGVESDSELGGALVGDIGYEGAVGGDWGLGLAGRIELYSIPSDDTDESLKAAALGVLFSATYH